MTSQDIASAGCEIELIGALISGRYRIQERLGEGGMGSVYLAEHTHMKKRVALKLLHPSMHDNAEVQSRFEREAMAASHVEHPNVAAATDFGRTEDGAYFLVLEYVEGTSLRDALESGPLTSSRALRIARQIAFALERAHDTGIVHRDLKPENVMLVRRPEEPDFVKVLDFGIAKVLELGAGVTEGVPRGNAGQPLTRLGTVLGTPEYMAPEQAMGEAITPAADLYAVGVILYEMLTGLHPFDPPDRMAMLSFHIVAPVPQMQVRAPNVHVPALLETIVRRLLEKDPKKRYENARALIDAIEEAARTCGIELEDTPRAASSSKVRISDIAHAQTNIAEPSPLLAATSKEAPRGRRFLALLLRQPRAVLVAIASALPIGFALVLVVALATGRSKSRADSSSRDSSEQASAASVSDTAPDERIESAVALGPDALLALTKEYPRDVSLLRQLATAYVGQGRHDEALRTVRTLLTVNGAAGADKELVELVSAIAAKSKGEDEAFVLLENSFGEMGVDALLELAGKGQEKECRARAAKSLAKPDVRARASAAAAVVLDFKAAQGCAAKHDQLASVREHGDARIMPSLKTLKSTRGCGFLKRGDCWRCMRADGALDSAIAAVEARTDHAP